MTLRPDVVIVGAGAFGLSAAVALRRRGRTVRVLDAGPVPHPDASSTDISKIVRMDYGADEHYARLALEAMAGWRKWNEEVDRPLYHEVGFALLAHDPIGAGGFEHDCLEVLGAMGHGVERLDGRDGRPRVHERFPAWAVGQWADGYHNPVAGWAESGRAVGWLADRARVAGVEIVSHAPVARVTDRGVHLVDGATIEAGSVVVAAGAWTPALLPELAEVMRIVGQPVFHLRPRDPGPFAPDVFPVWAGDIARTGWYGFPANADGIVKVANHGAGIPVDARAIPDVSARLDAKLRSFLARALPALAGAPVVGRRLCLYCDTADGDFWVDRSRSAPNVVIASGGSGHGFKFMPVIGDIVADVLDDVDNEWVHRFRWRTPDRSRAERARFHGDVFGA